MLYARYLYMAISDKYIINGCKQREIVFGWWKFVAMCKAC